MKKIKALLPHFIISFFTRGASRSIKVKRNIAFSFLIRSGNILISFLLVPLTINYVNPTQYGIWLTLSSIVAWFSFFDIGFGNGLRNKFAEAVARGKFKLARIYVSTTYAVLGIVIGVALLAFFVVNPFLNWSRILNTPESMAGELSTLAMLVFVFFCLQFILQLINVVLTANQEPAKAAAFKFYSNILSLLIIFILTKTTSGNLIYLGFALGITPVIALAGSSFWFYRKGYKHFAPAFRFVDFRFARNLMHLGIKFFIIQVSGIVLYSTDNIIITQMFGPAEVTPYNLAFKYFGTITVLFTIVLTPFWSAITEAYTKGDFPWIRRSVKTMVKISGMLMLVVTLMLVFADELYFLWVGDKVSVPFMLSAFMAVYFSMNLFLQPFTFFINGTGKIKLQLIQSVLMAALNIPLAIFLAGVPGLGIGGIILSTIICYIPGLVLTPIQYFKILNRKGSGLWVS